MSDLFLGIMRIKIAYFILLSFLKKHKIKTKHTQFKINNKKKKRKRKNLDRVFNFSKNFLMNTESKSIQRPKSPKMLDIVFLFRELQ